METPEPVNQINTEKNIGLQGCRWTLKETAKVFIHSVKTLEKLYAAGPLSEGTWASKVDYHDWQINQCVKIWPELYELLDNHKQLRAYCKVSKSPKWIVKAEARLFML